MVHELKTWPEPYKAIKEFRNLFEVRKDDRGFMIGDTLHLREWNPKTELYTGHGMEATIQYIFKDPGMGLLQENVVVLSLDQFVYVWTEDIKCNE